MKVRKSNVLLASVVVSALLGLVTYLSDLGEPESNDLVAPVIPKSQQRVAPVAAPTPPLLPLSSEEKEGAFAAKGGEEHRLTQDSIMEWIRNGQVLTAEDRNELLAFIAQPQPESMETGEWEERVNEILNLLRAQPGGVPGLADLMMKMAAEAPNPVMRMYALQHIAMWIPDEPSEESRKAMMDYLQRLASFPDDPLAGSAVLFLSDIQRNGSLPNDMSADGMIGETALRIASDATASPDVRIAALHACVDQGTATALPAARLIAADSALMIPLRKAAIHTIGEFGTEDDVGLLESLGGGEPALAGATLPAVEKLREGKVE